MVRKDVSDDTAYKITKAYFDQLPTMQKTNAQLEGPSAPISALVASLRRCTRVPCGTTKSRALPFLTS
ncbi:MAG: hypothetical protein R3E42_00910 [Burkholderiaceae bacterium]